MSEVNTKFYALLLVVGAAGSFGYVLGWQRGVDQSAEMLERELAGATRIIIEQATQIGAASRGEAEQGMQCEDVSH
jgi:hypothetical protein